jgi:hypothetical protein
MSISGSYWRSRVHRRRAVGSLYLGYGAIIGFCVLTSRGLIGHSLGTGLMGLSFLAGIFGAIGILQSRRTLFLAAGGVLDERQQSVRDRAYYTAYQLLALVVIAGSLYLGLLWMGRLPAPALSSTELMLVAGGVLLLTLTLPSAIMSWTEADPPEDSGAHGMINRRSL